MPLSPEVYRAYKREWRKLNPGRENPPARSGVWCSQCVVCDAAFVARRKRSCCGDVCLREKARAESLRAYHEKRKYVERAAKTCAGCGIRFEPHHGAQTKYCTAKCGRRDFARRHGKNNLTRARAAGVLYEPVDPIRVFDRDGWTCAMCGVKTPRGLRGSYCENAPELDHVIPIARGGSHTSTVCT